ncbi:MAG: glycosyltransferase [Calditrichia bacterium]|nr:glycosyltransferase [Calditrichota bacterium]MCB0286705.1 glycosyltransferase [Calditrichota bacterium]MCB9066487.1 glycosyltransferase [Calditrichia bacterium]
MNRLLILTTNFPPSKSIGTQRILRICKFLDRNRWKISVLTLKEKYYPEYNGDDSLPEFMQDVSVTRTGKLDVVHHLLNVRENIKKTDSGEDSAAEKPQKTANPVANGKANGAVANGVSLQDIGYKPAEKLAKRSKWQVLKDFFTDILQFPDKNMTWLPLAIWRGFWLIKKQKIDVIFSSSPPHSLHLMSAILKKLTGARLVIDFRDPWARSPWHDEERDANSFEKWKHDKIVAFERWVVRQADQVVLITQEMYNDYVAHYSDLPKSKFRLFNNGFDPENLIQFDGSEAETPRTRDKIRFIHAGSLYKHRDPSPILLAVKNLVDNEIIDRSKVEFIFLGAVTDHQKHTKALSEDLGLADVVSFISKVSYQKSLEYMANSDVLILLQPVTKLQLPGKFYDYICWDKPILAIAEEGSATKNVVVDRFGVFANFNEIEDIEKGIVFLFDNPDYLVESIRENRQFFNMANAIKTFDNILESR